MTIEPEDMVADIVAAAAGGRIVSRVRLQKIFYLLDKLNANSGFSFSYYHYGPYSRDLDTAVLDAKAFDKVTETFGERASDGARYSIFETKSQHVGHHFTFLTEDRLQKKARSLAGTDVTVLELAATAHWLKMEERVTDWKSEIVKRKGAKARADRLHAATCLLGELGLEPAST